MTLDPDALHRAWVTLPDPGIPGLEARWLGPSVDGELAGLIPSLSSEAYSHLAYTRWLDPIRAGPTMWRSPRTMEPDWVVAVEKAADRLQTSRSALTQAVGPHWWASWLLWELPEPHRHFAERYGRRPGTPLPA